MQNKSKKRALFSRLLLFCATALLGMTTAQFSSAQNNGGGMYLVA